MNTVVVPQKRVVVLHGYTANPGRHWFEWLSEELAADGVSVTTPALPDSSEPDLEAWIAAARTAIGTPDAGLVLVGHSLGCITALKALAAIDGSWKIGGLILVSGFDSHLANLPQLDAFTVTTVDYAPIIRSTGRIGMIVSDNDTIVDPVLSHRLAASLGAEVTVVPGAGHFRGDDGYTELPEVAAEIRAMLAGPE